MNKDLKELRLQREREDENKLLDAIHKQARDGYYFEKGKNYLKQVKKAKKREWLEHELETAILLIASSPVLTVLVMMLFWK